jgi:tetratricopeptide (TPR) repeat protein
MTTVPLAANIEPTLLAELGKLEPTVALALLQQRNLVNETLVEELASAALAGAEAEAALAQRWLAIAELLNYLLGEPPARRAQVRYTQARLYVQRGQLTLAETALRAAQVDWQRVADEPALARSYLGLTQILTLQGRLSDAETSGRAAVAQLQPLAAAEPAFIHPLAMAHRNLATVLVYQDRHAVALIEYEAAQRLLEQQLAGAADNQERTALTTELAHVALNYGNALMFLDRAYEAEAAYQNAANHFEQSADWLNRGRVRTNLGSLYLRTGRYAAALSQFEGATRDLIGVATPIDQVSPEQLRKADVLLLDYANAYLALNLLAEAGRALTQCEAIFRAAGQPHELGQSLLALGLVRARTGDDTGAQAALIEAEHLFAGLQNRFWQNRTALALATHFYQQGRLEQAATRLDRLLAQPANAAEATLWDIGLLVDVHLLRLRIHLMNGELIPARTLAAAATAILGLGQSDPLTLTSSEVTLPHLVLRLHQALGELERAAGNAERAQQHGRAALALLERQRVALPVEEIRMAFLDDKINIYSDLVLSLLERPDPTALAEAFATVERARSRVLLERLLATLSGEATEPTDPTAQRRAELEQQLHTLYNRLLGEAGSRHTPAQVGAAIRECEAALDQLAWQLGGALPEAQPVDLATLQAALPADQQVVLYYIAGTEVMAFVVDRVQARVVRSLCSSTTLEEALGEWRFQLGRAEMGAEYLLRHAARFEQGWRGALFHLHQLLIAPLAALLTSQRLLIIPYGPLHLLPFHALWDGRHFLLARFECSYAPSASLAVRALTSTPPAPYGSWAGLALTDPAIPAARSEVEAAARRFARSWLYVDEQADYAGLQLAASQAEVLHLATHGLFRADNPFFSVLKLADGWVDVRKLYRLPLAARLVVLSACESGAGQVRGGDEVIGLARGFLASGAQSLLVSLWNVHDASSAELMARFYDHLIANLTGQRPAAALRAAQLEQLQQTVHPYFWAPFLAIGA